MMGNGHLDKWSADLFEGSRDRGKEKGDIGRDCESHKGSQGGKR